MKQKIRRLSDMCGKLNLYFARCTPKKERVRKELSDIAKYAQELLAEIDGNKNKF